VIFMVYCHHLPVLLLLIYHVEMRVIDLLEMVIILGVISILIFILIRKSWRADHLFRLGVTVPHILLLGLPLILESLRRQLRLVGDSALPIVIPWAAAPHSGLVARYNVSLMHHLPCSIALHKVKRILLLLLSLPVISLRRGNASPHEILLHCDPLDFTLLVHVS
jgi:hypothetical protein